MYLKINESALNGKKQGDSMFKNKILVSISLLFVVAFCAALFMFAVSLAETPASPEAIDLEINSSEVLTPEASEAANKESANLEKDNAINKDIVKTNANEDCPFTVLKSDGSPASSSDYKYTESSAVNPGILSILSDGLIVSNTEPATPANAIISVDNNQRPINSLTLKNINIDTSTDNFNVIYIKDSFTNDYTFNLYIKEDCKINFHSKSYAFLNCIAYETHGSGTKNFNIIGDQNSKLSLITTDIAEGIDADVYDTCKLNFSLCGYLKLYIDSSFSFEVYNIYDEGQVCQSSIDFFVKDNVDVEINDRSSAIGCSGNITLQNNSYLKIKAGSGISIYNDRSIAERQQKFSVLGNACADITCGGVPIETSGTLIYINTSGYVTALSSDSVAYNSGYDDEPEVCPANLNVVSGKLYLTGNNSDYGLLDAQKPFNMDVADGYSVVGSPDYNVSIDDLLYSIYIDDNPIYTDDEQSMFVNSGTAEPQLAKTVAFIPPNPPAPDPTPDPAPVVESVTAQTGDGMGLAVALCELFLIASAGYMLSRKLYNN